jgi:hypothetical protein
MAIGLAAGVAAPIAYALSGAVGLWCVLIAAAACGLPGMLVLVVQHLCRHPQLVLLHVLAGFFVRLGAPMAICMIVYLQDGPLVEAGFAGYLLGLYLVALSVGTLLDLTQQDMSRLKGVGAPH